MPGLQLDKCQHDNESIISNETMTVCSALALQVSGLTCSQLKAVLLKFQGQRRCGAVVALWSKVLDRHNLVKVGSWQQSMSR